MESPSGRRSLSASLSAPLPLLVVPEALTGPAKVSDVEIPLLDLLSPAPATKIFAVQDPTTTSTPATPNVSGSQTGSAQASPTTGSGRSLSGGAIAGIVIGSLVGIALLAAVALFIARHRDFGAHSGRGGRSLSHQDAA